MERRDYEDKRRGAANVFVIIEPRAGWRHVQATAHRTKRDDAACIRVVRDNLSTHTAGALYEAFPPQQSRRILARLEFHYTPKHGSWLNQAEIEISIVERGCLSRLVPDLPTLEQRVRAMEAERNARQVSINWQFTVAQARIKLKRLYPMVEHPQEEGDVL